jgi:hypothetical protein
MEDNDNINKTPLENNTVTDIVEGTLDTNVATNIVDENVATNIVDENVATNIVDENVATNIVDDNKDVVNDKKNNISKEEIKVVNLGNNFNSNVNSNFNNNFGETLEITQDENKPDKQLFLKIIENEMLKNVPVELQSRLSIQKNIFKKANTLYNVMENARKIIKKEKESGRPLNNIIDNLLDGNFDTIKYLYPVVLDERVIYTLKCDEKDMIDLPSNFENNNLNNLQNELKNDEYSLTIKAGKVPYGDKLENQNEKFQEINSLYKKRYLNDINLATFYSGLQKQRDPYKEPTEDFWDAEDVPKVKRMKLKNYNELIRYINLNNQYRITKRVGRGPYIIPLGYPNKKDNELLTEEELQIKQKITAVSGEHINITGFLYIPLSILPEKELILEATRNKVFIDNKSFKLNIEKPSLILFNYAKNEGNHEVEHNEFIRLIRKSIPTDDNVTDFIFKNNNNLNLVQFINKLKEWGYNLNTITNDTWDKVKNKLNDSKETIDTYKGIDINKIGKECSINDNELIDDNNYNSKLINTVYLKKLNYTTDKEKIFRGEDCDINRSSILFNTNDNGDFYYSYFFNRNKSKIDVKKLKKIKDDFKIKQEIPEINFEDNEITKEKLEELKKEFKKIKSTGNITQKEFNLLEEQIKNYETDNEKYNKTVVDKANFIIMKQLSSNIILKDKMSNALLGKIMYNKELKKKEDEEKDLLFELDNVSPVLKSILKQINQIDSYEEKKDLLYSIINLDGVLIDKYIYSNFYKKPFLCGHWYYQMKIDNIDDNYVKQKNILKLLSLFGDEGKEQDNCKVCGAYLERAKFVENLYIDQWGNPLKIREDVDIEEIKIKYKHSLPANPNTTIQDLVKNYKSEYFLNTLKTRKITENKMIKLSINAAQLLNGFLNKLDININNKHYIDLLVVCVRESKKISSLQSYFEDRLNMLKIKKKISEDKINRLRNSQKFIDKISSEYTKYFTLRYATLIVAHLLWYFRTSIPIHKLGYNSTTSCSFFGFENDNGFNFMVCIIQEMKIFSLEGRVPKYEISKNLRYWVNSLEPNYKYALLKRKNYENDIKLFDIRKGSNRYDKVENPIDWGEQEITDIIPDEFINNTLKLILKGNNGDKFDNLYQDILVKIKVRANKIRNFYDEFINEAPKTYGDLAYQSSSLCTCCETDVEEKINFVDYFDNINPIIINYSKDLKKLQKIYNSLNNLLLYKTTLQLATVKKPIDNVNELPINLLDIPESYMKIAFNTYCYEGESYGEKHIFENMNSYDNSESKCIKCQMYLNNINETIFTREQFVKLLNNVNLKTLQDYNIVYKDKDTKKLLILKKRTKLKNIDRDIKILASKISKYILAVKNNEKKEKEIYDYVKNFLNNLDDFSNIIPNQEYTKKEKIINENILKKFSIKKMKEYINEYFRKNVSRIKHNYVNKNKYINNLISKENERWQKILIVKNEWITQFLNSKNKKIFKKFTFSYSIKYINNIISIPSMHNEDYESIISDSNFNNDDAINVLKNYFIKEMLLFIDLAKSNEPIIAEFYLKMFQEIEKDRKIINLSENSFVKWKDTIQEEKNIMRAKYYNILKEEKSAFEAPYIQNFESIYNNPIFDPKLTSTTDVEEEQREIDEEEKEQELRERAENIHDNQQSIEDFVQDALEEEMNEEEVMGEVYDNNILKEGEDIIDVGYDYGDQEQGIDNEGDGFNDYSLNDPYESPVEKLDEGDEVME